MSRRRLATGILTALALGTATQAAPAGAREVCPAPSTGHVSCLADVTQAPLQAATPPPASQPPKADTPQWLQQAYDLTNLAQTAGSGQTVAIVDAYGDSTAESDLANYRTMYGLPACTTANGCFSKVDENGGTAYPPDPTGSDAGWLTETSLDLDAVSALCPNCHILLVQAASASTSDLTTAEATAASLGATQISNSWSGGEYSSEASLQADFSFPGVAVVASSGDNGYPNTGFPSAFPNVTAAGGTSLRADSSARGFSESAWSGAGSGCSPYIAKPAWQTDSGCTDRTIADLSADADPNTGLVVYDSQDGLILAGGTSLASPLIAAYFALVGGSAGVGNAQWAYTNAALLNDPTGGSTGSCSSAYLCQGVIGYDAPTGTGSISGDVVAGPPGIGGSSAGSIADTTATLSGGVFANQQDTTVWWQYGTTNSYGSSTTPTDAGSASGATAVSTPLTALLPSTTYHYRLVAHSSLGTTYGYDHSFTTTATQQSGGGSTSSGSPTPTQPVPVVAPPATQQPVYSPPATVIPPVTVPVQPVRSGSTTTRTRAHHRAYRVLRVVVHHRRARVRLDCATRCHGQVVVRTRGGQVLGRVSVDFTGRRWVSLRLTPLGRRAMAARAAQRTVVVELMSVHHHRLVRTTIRVRI